MWKSGLLLARFPRGSWEEWEACFLAFHAFHSPGISIAPRLPGCRPGRSGLSALLHLSHCLLLASATHKSCYRSVNINEIGLTTPNQTRKKQFFAQLEGAVGGNQPFQCDDLGRPEAQAACLGPLVPAKGADRSLQFFDLRSREIAVRMPSGRSSTTSNSQLGQGCPRENWLSSEALHHPRCGAERR